MYIARIFVVEIRSTSSYFKTIEKCVFQRHAVGKVLLMTRVKYALLEMFYKCIFIQKLSTHSKWKNIFILSLRFKWFSLSQYLNLHLQCICLNFVQAWDTKNFIIYI